ncbi:unnamed protein product [Mycena citricolor]|uniref:TEA domain-containing protein n=1 Tax=Mycena citricolor TaxID=2018698 RepID=A0AAD2H1C5_9AGAR|nr:unnamed protein product [Mycena citricolor]
MSHARQNSAYHRPAGASYESSSGSSPGEFSSTMSRGSSVQGSMDERLKGSLPNITKKRKTWKKSSDGQVIWPPDLEAALVKGLEKYVPPPRAGAAFSNRYPGRNRFLSNFILETTGERRSCKQVGSRIQQIRESAHSGQNELDRMCGIPSTSDHLSPAPGAFAPAQEMIVNIPIYPQSQQPSVHGAAAFQPQVYSTYASKNQRQLATIDPTICFSLPVQSQSLSARSAETVILTSSQAPVHSETTQLSLRPGPEEGSWVYTTSLVPNFWQVFVQDPDPSRYEIRQQVVSNLDSRVLFSATYRFVYHGEPSQTSAFPSPQSQHDRGDYYGQTQPYNAQQIAGSSHMGAYGTSGQGHYISQFSDRERYQAPQARFGETPMRWHGSASHSSFSGPH